jgi:hypothetical protein
MRQALNATFLATILLWLAFLGYAGDEQAAAPAQDQEERKAGTEPKGIVPSASAASYAAYA